jgi:hypothetical protein
MSQFMRPDGTRFPVLTAPAINATGKHTGWMSDPGRRRAALG